MFFRFNFFGIIWAVIILFLTLTPGADMPYTDIWSLFRFDRFAHLFVFAILVLLLTVGFRKQYSFHLLRNNNVRIALGVSVLYGITLELLQGAIPGRSLELIDFVANTLGSLGGTGIYFLIYKL
ncbi:VanZ family protein [Roseivirga sp. BDSF3-8]|uniref:VanZ family protein n=1 Tax=Roseivirga sp. BDSF3-8 TaxID=3241598 RepID=UPI003531E68A